MIVRPYSPADASAILDIYRPYIEDGPVTFETEVPSLADFTKRLNTIAEQYPFMVLDEGGKVLGYVYACKYRERAAYRWHVETSIYMSAEGKGQGLGKKLYLTLLDELTKRRFTRAFAIVGVPNTASEQLHLSCGFKPLVLHEKAGWKQGGWRDVLWLIHNLYPETNPPEEPLFGPWNGLENW